MKLCGELADEARPEVEPRGRPDQGPALLGPGQPQPRVIDRQSDLDVPGVIGQGAVFRCVGAQLVERHGQGQNRSRTDIDRNVLNNEPLAAPALERLDRRVNDVGQFGARPLRLKQHVMRPSQGDQSAFDRHTAFLQSFGGPQASRRDGDDGRQRVLHAMMQFFQQKPLNPLGGFILGGIDAGLHEKMCGIDSSLRQQVAEIGILHFEGGFAGVLGIARHGQEAR